MPTSVHHFLLLSFFALPIWGFAQLPPGNLLQQESQRISLLAFRPFADKATSMDYQPLNRIAFLELLPPSDLRWVPGAPTASAFFCRLEVQIEQRTRFPVRFRLGDVQYVDYLEGKRPLWE